MFRVRIRLGFKVSQSIPAYIHQIMNDLSKSGDLPRQESRYPKLDADPNIGPIRYVLIHKALMPESKVSQRGANFFGSQVCDSSFCGISGRNGSALRLTIR